MLIFLKSARGLHKNAHFFPIFLNIEYSYSLIFSTDWWQSTLSSYLCLRWLTLFLDDNVDEAILERVW